MKSASCFKSGYFLSESDESFWIPQRGSHLFQHHPVANGMLLKRQTIGA